ncbi:3'-5' exonuclease family protein [Ralstonia pseudosolanacearum]|uniref:3'-5' exoribonuclease n=1 Tax=Ralstonia solanacearum TaxID=305 RepID=A0A0S4WQN2_RALSL|nr:3'-5' exoribonuclease [Ralstonia sp. RS650]UZF15504.1 3'-5' exoribonuclease [Ralstonia solanacearum]UZF30587.1 3'-5' exoribonuclease [Ralstonia sp. RS650]CUV53632.1 protein of unknown function [Ralstonia solanacearum]
MTRDELIAAVPIWESQGRLYVRIDDVPEPWRQQFAAAMEGSAFIAIQGETCITPFAHDWNAWVRDQWDGRPGPTGLDERLSPDLGKLESKGPRSPWKTRYFVDTEFTDFIDCRLISIAIVGEDGSEFYGECSDVDLSVCSEFVRAAVLPQLGQFPGRSMPAAQLRDELRAWLLAMSAKPKRVLCFDYQGDYDLVLDLLDGEMPVGWNCEHVGGKLDVERLERYFREHGGRHHALHDARANAFSFR